jgi:hypothetical protein
MKFCHEEKRKINATCKRGKGISQNAEDVAAYEMLLDTF